MRLNGAQQREKDAAEAAIADIKQTLELEEDESKKDLLRAQVKSSEAKLEEMLSTFEVSGSEVIVVAGFAAVVARISIVLTVASWISLSFLA